MLKAVLFDMDGVIIDSEPLHARAAVLALQRYHVPVSLAYVYDFVGCTTYSMCQKMIADYQLPLTPEELLQAINDNKDYLVQTEGYAVIPYIIDVMRDLHSHGIKLIIASSSSPEAIEKVMHTLGLSEFFEGYVSGSMVAHPKPAPDIFLLAAKQLGVRPDECIVIEDSHHGVCAAAAAGIPSIGFVNPNSGKQDLRKAAILVEGFDEIDFDFISKIYQMAHKKPITIAETEHFILRELTISDMDPLFELYRQPEIKTYLQDFSDDLDTERKKLQAYIEQVYHYYGFGLWGVFFKDSKRLVGLCGVEYKLLNHEEIYELGYLLDTKHQGQGYAREFATAVIDYAFGQLALPAVTVLIDKENKRSLQLAVSLGMQYVGECYRNQSSYLRYELINDHL